MGLTTWRYSRTKAERGLPPGTHRRAALVASRALGVATAFTGREDLGHQGKPPRSQPCGLLQSRVHRFRTRISTFLKATTEVTQSCLGCDRSALSAGVAVGVAIGCAALAGVTTADNLRDCLQSTTRAGVEAAGVDTLRRRA